MARWATAADRLGVVCRQRIARPTSPHRAHCVARSPEPLRKCRGRSSRSEPVRPLFPEATKARALDRPTGPTRPSPEPLSPQYTRSLTVLGCLAQIGARILVQLEAYSVKVQINILAVRDQVSGVRNVTPNVFYLHRKFR
jgi:hypothetical protein